MAGFKELRIASFDPDYATLQGYRPRLIDFALTAAATLAAFATVIAVVGYSGAAALETSGSATMATAGGLAVAAAVVIRRLGLRARRPVAALESGQDSAVRPLRPGSGRSPDPSEF